jgi:hypothetical protein
MWTLRKLIEEKEVTVTKKPAHYALVWFVITIGIMFIA